MASSREGVMEKKSKAKHPRTKKKISAGRLREIRKLRKEKLRLEEELSALRTHHVSIASTYGSELCAGEMLGKENLLAGRIAKINEGIVFLESTGKSLAALEEEIVAIDSDMLRLPLKRRWNGR